jgi:hypothetical protein
MAGPCEKRSGEGRRVIHGYWPAPAKLKGFSSASLEARGPRGAPGPRAFKARAPRPNGARTPRRRA